MTQANNTAIESSQINSSGVLQPAGGGTGTTTSTGSGSAVLNTSPTLVTPALGTPSAAVLTNATGLPLSTGVTGTLPIANGGTGSTTAATVAGTGISVSGTFPNQTVTNAGVTSVSGSGTVSVSASTGGVTITGTDYLTKTTGSAPYYGARAWAYWSSNGTVNGSANVSSVTVNGTGQYTVNFSTAMPDTNYAAVGGTGDSGGRNSQMTPINDGASLSTSSVFMRTTNGSASNVSNSYNYIVVFR